MKCVNGTYVDACNTCQCAKEPNENLSLYRITQEHEYIFARTWFLAASDGRETPSSCSLHRACRMRQDDRPRMCEKHSRPNEMRQRNICGRVQHVPLREASDGRESPSSCSLRRPVGCGGTIGQGCEQSIVDDMNCTHGTYMDMCNMCHCAKGLNEILSLYHIVHGHGYPLQGPGPLHPLPTPRPVQPAVSTGPAGCGSGMGQGCMQSIVDNMNCDHGTYVDTCNLCQCAKVRSVSCQGPAEPAVSGSPVEYNKTRSQGCVQNTVDDMKCAHGTYVDMCNRCQCAKGPNETCGGTWGEHGRCTSKLHCFVENVTLVGKCRLNIDG
ncbi:neuroparsin [Penaeus vannamei]|uniref:Neuroparsin n=1 Tax=Penaeus vannamei TaxID=6689 RepID=A0A3R7P4Y6_PENVA|nr:neuroparsin [Penaeus vannamei]